MRSVRAITLIGVILAMCTVTQAQTSTTRFPKSSAVVDASGNLIYVESGVTLTMSSGTSSSSMTEIRDTRVTVVSAGATAAGTPVTYSDVVFKRLGVGKSAVYFEVTVRAGSSVTRQVIALNANLPLPGSLSGFPALPLADGDEVRLARPVGTSDYISIVTPGSRATATTSATSPIASVYSFTSGAFQLVSKATLP